MDEPGAPADPVMSTYQHEGGRDDGLAHVKPLTDPLGEGGLPSTKFSGGDDDVTAGEFGCQDLAQGVHGLGGGHHHSHRQGAHQIGAIGMIAVLAERSTHHRSGRRVARPATHPQLCRAEIGGQLLSPGEQCQRDRFMIVAGSDDHRAHLCSRMAGVRTVVVPAFGGTVRGRVLAVLRGFLGLSVLLRPRAAVRTMLRRQGLIRRWSGHSPGIDQLQHADDTVPPACSGRGIRLGDETQVALDPLGEGGEHPLTRALCGACLAQLPAQRIRQ